MSKDSIFSAAMVAYIAVGCVAYGYFVKSMIALFGLSLAHLIFGIPVAMFWPVSSLIWFGVWLA